MPDSATAVGVLDALVSRVRLADLWPPFCGANRTPTWQLAPAPTACWQRSPIRKSPGSVPPSTAPEMTSGADPSLVTVRICSAPTVPCGWVPKLRVLVLSLAAGAA